MVRRTASCDERMRALTMAKTGPKPIPVETRFWRFVSKGSDDDCWMWTGNKLPSGYGLIGVNKRTKYAHRLSYEIAKGPIPDGLIVMHHCDNPSCVNPAHLSVGTYADNNADMMRKGRHKVVSLRGERHPLNIFTELTAQRLKIVSGAIGYWKLAKMIGKPISATQGVMNGKNWAHLCTRQALTV